MKRILISLLLLAQVYSPKTQASGDALGAAIGALAVTGFIYTINSNQYDEWLKSEMESWKYEETGSTSSLSRSCDVTMELRLHRSRRISYVMFILHNESDKPITVQTNDIFSTYPNGATRRFKTMRTISDVKVDAGWTIQGFYPISEKHELRDIDSLELTIPTVSADGKTTCQIKGQLERNKNRPADYFDYNRLLTLEFGFSYGNNTFASSSLANTSKGKDFFDLNFDVYFYKNLGIHFGLVRQDYKGTYNSTLKSYHRVSGPYELSVREFLFGAAANFLQGRKYSVTAEAGIMDSTLVNTEEQDNELEHKTGYYANGRFNYIFYSSDYGPFHGDYMVGAGALLRYVPKYTVSTAEFGGVSLAPYLNFTIGL